MLVSKTVIQESVALLVSCFYWINSNNTNLSFLSLLPSL